MSPSEAISYFGTQVKLAERLGIKQGSVGDWVANGYIPWPRQFQIQVATGGELLADETDPAPKRTASEAA